MNAIIIAGYIILTASVSSGQLCPSSHLAPCIIMSVYWLG